MTNSKSINVVNFTMEGVDFSINEAFESRVDDINATMVANVKDGALRRTIAYNREAVNVQAVSFVYREKAVWRMGKDEALAAEADYCYVVATDNNGKERRHFVGYAKQAVMRLEESELSRLGAFKITSNGIAYVTEKAGVVSRTIKDFSDEIVVMDFTSANLGDGTNRLSQVLATEVILKVEANGVCRWYMKNDKGFYVDLRFNVSTKTFNKGVKITQFPKGAKINTYIPFGGSASMERGNSVYLLKADRLEMVLTAEQEEINRLLEEGLKASYNKAVGKAAAIVNILSGGVYERQMASLKGEEVRIDKRNKLASRMMLPITNSRRFGEVEKLAIANFEITETDGHGWFNQDFLVTVFKEMYPEADVSETMFNGFWMQARIEASVKGGHTPVRKELLAQLILAASKKYGAEIIYLEKKHLTPAFYKYMDGKGSAIMKKRYDGKILIYGTNNLEEVEFFGDLTVFKTIPNLGEKLPVALMNTAAPHGKTCDTSNQVIAKLLQVDGALPVLKEMVKETVDKKWAMEKKDITSFSELGSVDYGVNILQKIAPELIFADEKLAASTMETLVESSVKAIGNLNIPVEGFNAIMIPDYGFLFGIKLIADDEVFIPDARYVGRVCEAVRHPSASGGEHKRLKAVGCKRVCMRAERACHEGKISRIVCDLLQELFKSLKGNVTIMAINSRLVNLLGGADWDGDTVNLYFDPRIVALLAQVPEEAIDYGQLQPSNEMVEVDHRMLVDSYKSFVDCGNRPVGVVVNFITSMAGTLAAIETGKFKENELKEFLMYIKRAEAQNVEEDSELDPEDIFAILSRSGEGYKRQFVGDNLFIDAKRREEFAEYVKSVGVASPTAFRMFLADMIKAYSGIANDTIDAAKKGGKVSCWFFKLGKYIKSGLKANISFVYDEEGNLVVNKPELGLVENGALYVSEDIAAELKIYGADLIRDKIEEFKVRINGHQRLGAFEDDIYGDVDFYAADKTALRGLSFINTKLNNGAPESYKDLKGYVLAFARYLAKAATSSVKERYELFKEASVMKDGSYSGFYTKFGPEIVSIALEDKDYILRSRLYSLMKGIVVEDGDKIELVNGKAMNGIFTEDNNLNGIFDIEVINGVAYATKSAKSYVDSMMDDDKFVVDLNTFGWLKERMDLSGKNGINTTIAAANIALKEQVNGLMDKVNSGEYRFKFHRTTYNGLALVAFDSNGRGEKFPINIAIPGKLKDNALTEALNGKEVKLDNIVQFNYYRPGMVRGKNVPEFEVAIAGTIVK